MTHYDPLWDQLTESLFLCLSGFKTLGTCQNDRQPVCDQHDNWLGVIALSSHYRYL